VEIEFRVQPVELSRTDERVHGGGSLAAAVGPNEEEVLASEGDSPERPFGRAVVDLEQAIFGVAREGNRRNLFMTNMTLVRTMMFTRNCCGGVIWWPPSETILIPTVLVNGIASVHFR
jgi:hypothetical protein